MSCYGTGMRVCCDSVNREGYAHIVGCEHFAPKPTEITQAKLDAVSPWDNPGEIEILRTWLAGHVEPMRPYPAFIDMVARFDRVIEALASQALRSQGEAVAWQHRGKRRGAKVFAEWRDGRNQSYDTAEGDEFEERRLYTHPAPQEAGEVKVKPLEWVDGKAKTAQVTYAVKKTMFGWSWVAMTGVGAFASKPCAATEDEAKALAQAHHNQAILSSLEPS